MASDLFAKEHGCDARQLPRSHALPRLLLFQFFNRLAAAQQGDDHSSAPQPDISSKHTHVRQVVVGVPADMAFVVTSCSDLLEDVEVEVEQASPNFIIAGYFKVPTLSPLSAPFPMSRLTPLDTDNHELAAALQRIVPSQGHSTHCWPATCTRCSLQEPEGPAACPSDQARLGAARRNVRVCDAARLTGSVTLHAALE